MPKPFERQRHPGEVLNFYLRYEEAGKMRVEGKAYVVNNGDVIHFLFNV